MIETGVSRSEVVQREAASHCLEIRGYAAGRGHILCNCALSDFNRSAFQRKTSVLRDLPDMPRQSRILQLQRGDIERQPETLSMEHDGLKCLLQNLAADLPDQAVALRQGDENVWGDRAEIRMLPTCEHLKTVKLARRENHKWLEIGEEFVVFQCTDKVPLVKFRRVGHRNNRLGSGQCR